MKTSELTGVALDWAVAKCEYVGEPPFVIWDKRIWEPNESWQYNPSTDWSQGGPIIEREDIDIVRVYGAVHKWEASLPVAPCRRVKKVGVSPLIAAMRCYVASKLGDKVDIPEDLS